jgi:serine/threonine-protein kinase RsbW
MADFAADIIAGPEAIAALTDRAQAFLAESGVDARAAHHVALVLDELLSNCVSHGGGNTTPASVRLLVQPDRVDGQICDCGAEFDPRQQTPPVDTTATIADRAVGGLGLLLVHRVTDGFHYQRIGERNHTSFWIRRTRPE